jgi:cysteinyl-tRNA synthetase
MRIDEFTRKLLCLPPDLPHPDVAIFVCEFEQKFYEAMGDDFNISGAIGALFDFIKKLNPVLQTGSLEREQKNIIMESLRKINCVLGILRLEQCPLAPEIDKMIKERERARQQKDWHAADDVRDELLKKGITVRDTATGPVWEKIN